MAQSPSRTSASRSSSVSLCDADNLYKNIRSFSTEEEKARWVALFTNQVLLFYKSRGWKSRENCWEAAVHPTNARHAAAIWLVDICLARNSNLLPCTLVCSSLRSFVRTVSRLEAWLLSSENIWFTLRITFQNPWLISGNTRDFSQTWVERQNPLVIVRWKACHKLITHSRTGMRDHTCGTAKNRDRSKELLQFGCDSCKKLRKCL